MPTSAFPKNEAVAVKMVAEKVESIRQTIKDIIQIADEFELNVVVLNEFDDYLSYQGSGICQAR